MSDNSAIEWTDATWNPITGCAVVSPGCANCYAMKLAGARLRHHPSRAGLTAMSKAGPVWNGKVRFNEEWLTQPLQWKRPRRIFVCAHGDLFAEAVPDEWIDRVFAVMALAPQHTFQVLTKRSRRMRDYLLDQGCDLPDRSAGDGPRLGTVGRIKLEMLMRDRAGALGCGFNWPLPNVWLGVSAEDQERADERIPDLLATPAVVRFVSAEPLLGPIDLTRIRAPADPHDPEAVWLFDGLVAGDLYEQRFDNGFGDVRYDTGDGPYRETAVDWVIVGGESGHGARPMHPQWVSDIRDQCQAADVAFFFKQWGEWGYFGRELAFGEARDCVTWPLPLGMLPYGQYLVGKKRAGRLLDGCEWNEMPERRA